jgi:hypothetical protein
MDPLRVEIPELNAPIERSTSRDEVAGRPLMKTGFSVSAILE